MLYKQELINKIKDYFNLNVYETKIWLALLGKGVASAGEIASISGVPRSRTYDVLEGLEKKGFVIVKLEKPIKYLGVKPQVIIEKLKNNVKKEAEERVVELSKIKSTNEFLSLEELYNEGISSIKRENISAALKGKSNITNHLREILQNAEREVIICTNANEMLSKIRLFKQTLSKLEKNGINVKIALSGDENTIKTLSEQFGIKSKKVDIDAKFFIVDRKEVLFYISKGIRENDMAIWLNSDFFSEAFAALFEKAMK